MLVALVEFPFTNIAYILPLLNPRDLVQGLTDKFLWQYGMSSTEIIIFSSRYIQRPMLKNKEKNVT